MDIPRDNRIRITGSKRDIERAEDLLSNLHTSGLSEGDARLKIQKVIEEQNLKASVLFDGNSVWNGKKIIRNLKQIIKAGVLYRKDKPRSVPIGSMLRMPVGGDPLLTKYFYGFLNLCCGSIAHYNIHGWILQYPTVEDLRQFFIKNEFGQRVLDHTPAWQTDVKRIVEEIEKLLVPTRVQTSL